MPEGHQTHFLADRHCQLFQGHRVAVSSPQGRFREGAAEIDGCKLRDVTAVGKQLFYDFGSDRWLQIHLGRYGKFRQHENPAPEPVGQVRLRMADAQHTIDLSGPTTCRVIDGDRKTEIVEGLGPDPLGSGTLHQAWSRVRRSHKPIGALLLDQSVIAGVGNIFRAEVLFEVRENPLTSGDEISEDAFAELWKCIGRMMRKGLRYGRIITVTSDEVDQPLYDLKGKERFRVYGRDSCPACGGSIATDEIGGRKLYYCPNCQQDG